LTLVRHAHAGDAPRGGGDFERPLTPAGLAAASDTARQLAQGVPAPQRVRTSPSRRTWTTATHIAEIAFPGLSPEPAEALYLADLDVLISELRLTPASCEHLMLVGHNPGLSELCALLLRDSSFAGLAPAQWISIELETGWAGVGASHG
jgi:phosphohistidine phosphatase